MGLAEKIRIGCSGWSYKDWSGTFYPKDLPAKDYLSFYSRVFDCVEIDSSFYRIPLPSLVDAWGRVTPDGFMLAAKMPRRITHDNRLENVDPILARLYSVLSRLGTKLGPIVAQLPPSIKLDKHEGILEKFLSQLDPKLKHAVEFRHNSWFTPRIYQLLQKYNVAFCWSLNRYLTTPPEVTASFCYLRMVGERDITEFSGIQKDRSSEMKQWALKLDEKSGFFDDAFVFFNNHFAGFGPQSVNEFRRLSGLMEMDWTKVPGRRATQKTLTEF